MSDWNTHLYCANIVNQILQLDGKELNMFLFGNLLPDVNMGWNIDPDVKMSQEETHFDAMGQDYFWAPLRFYKKYETKLKAKNPLFLGYLFHLWLDVSFMTDFVSRIPMSDMISKHYEVRQSKWKDGELFIREYHFVLSLEYIHDICEASKGIEEIKISENDLKKVVGYINDFTPVYEGNEYTVYNQSEFEQFYERVSKDFISWIMNLEKETVVE